jgi:hypothetical protein
MDPHSDPNLITVKVTVPGPDDETTVRKFKATQEQIQKEAIHKTVLIPAILISISLILTLMVDDGQSWP